MFHKAGWITSPFYPDMFPDNADSIVRSVYLRKEFAVEKDVRSAVLTVCALGLGIGYLNGKKVTDNVLTTPYTVYDKRVLYNTYDVTSLMAAGANCMAFELGNGFYNDNMESWKDRMAPWRDVPKLLASLHIVYSDGSEAYVDSDRSFRTCPGPILFNHMRQGEMYDARCEQEGFALAGFFDGEWMYAKRVNPPGGVMEPARIPPIRVMQEYHPIRCAHGIYDFGVNISGWAKIRVKGERGTQITLTFDERLSEDGTKLYCDRTFASEEEKKQWRGSNAIVQIEDLPFAHKDIYILKGGSTEEWTPSFCYHGFRYVKVVGAPEDFEITAQFVHTDLEPVGSFVCDDEMLNTLHEMSIRSTLSNNVGIPTDCPHREQNGWPGDAMLASRQAFLNFDMFDFYHSWLRNYKDVQRPSGQLPSLIPTASWGFNWGPCPLTDGSIVRIPYYAWLSTGKTDMIEALWENMARYFDYVDSIAEDHLVEYGLSPDWSCSDLLVPCPLSACDTAVTHSNLMVMAKVTRIIGRDERPWLARAEKYKAAWRREFLNKKELWDSQTFLAIAVYYGMLEGEENQAAADRIAELIHRQEDHFNTGIMGVCAMFTVLSEYGHIDTVYRATVNETYPSYAYWVRCGLTTLAEDWDMSQSQNHQMFSEVDHWLYRYVGGIRHTDDGLVIAPLPLKDVSYVKVTHKGISVERKGSEVTVTLPQSARILIGNTDTVAPAGTHRFTF